MDLENAVKELNEVLDSQYNNDLRDKYKNAWINELKTKAPEFLSNPNFSNPYFIGVSQNYAKAKYKIMIVGEEGYGH